MPNRSQTKNINDVDEFLKNVSVDNVIFGYHERKLMVLLQRPIVFNKWTITGGYIKKTESIEEAAARIAFERTGLKELYLEQFRSFGNPERIKDEAFTPELTSKVYGPDIASYAWMFDYTVSIGFYTLTEYSLVTAKKGPVDEEIDWWPIDELPVLMFDHKQVIAEALKALQLHIYLYPVGYELLPEKFTLPEIHNLYETILGKPLHNGNFSRKLMSTGIVKKLAEKRNIGAHRAPFLYKFDKKKYDAALKDGLFFGF
jgi:ADP-ribose pyrophosphatase YjhB (NUDIX family)